MILYLTIIPAAIVLAKWETMRRLYVTAKQSAPPSVFIIVRLRASCMQPGGMKCIFAFYEAICRNRKYIRCAKRKTKDFQRLLQRLSSLKPQFNVCFSLYFYLYL